MSGEAPRKREWSRPSPEAAAEAPPGASDPRSRSTAFAIRARAGALVLAGGLLAASSIGAQTPSEWCPEPEARQFDFWIGEWDVQNRNRPPGGDRWFETGTATARVYPVVGGCALVEHWRGYAFPSAGHIVGFSVRAWDPDAGRWELALLWPVGGPPRFGNPEGRFENGRGVFETRFTTPQGDPGISRLVFSEVEDDSFRWSNALSTDGGETWSSSWIMEQRRRPRTAPGLWNGPSMTVDRCPGPAHRAFDRWLGEWTGVRTAGDGDGTAARTYLARILEGCAIMERTSAEDGSWASFRVRAWEPAEERWVEYAVASDRRRLHRREAETTPEGIVFTDVEPVDGVYRRTRWESDGAGLRRIEEAAPEPAGPWRRLWEERFPGRVGVTPLSPEQKTS